jgi:hypothetical protein
MSIAGHEWLANIRKNFQGHTMASIKLLAEHKYAVGLAFELAEESLCILRFCSPANLVANGRCFCTARGRENLRKRHYFAFKQDNLLPLESEGIDEASFQPWMITSKELAELRKVALDSLSSLLSNQSRSGFQKKVLTSIMLYSRASLCTDKADKLLYVLVSLEALLLKDENEPIQQNIADRIAFITAKQSAERIDIVRIVKKAYGLRSAFVHHGESPEDTATFSEFLRIAWLFYTQVFLNLDRFKTTADFFGAIDRAKYT